MDTKPQTWHYRLVARYWAEHNVDGPEIAYFPKQIEREGQPALDAGCGTGRLLLPFLRAGFTVEAVRGAYTEAEATATDDVIVLSARK